MQISKEQQLEREVLELKAIVETLHYEDIASTKIFAQAKNKFTNWMLWSVVGVTLGYGALFNSVLESRVKVKEAETVKQELIQELKQGKISIEVKQ